MSSWLWNDGHLGWVFYSLLVFSMVAVLLADYIWRRVKMPARVLLSAALGFWLLGGLLIILI